MEEARKKRIRLILAYDGTAYHGWQVQENAASVAGEVNKALEDLLGEPVQVIGASRTDTGVHALGNVAIFDTQARMPAEKFAYALNQRLPEDIRVQKSEEVSLDWHPHHAKARKTYTYRIFCGTFPLPTKRLYSYFTYHTLDVNRMQQAAVQLIGEHDFASFCAAGAQVQSTVRTIYDLQVEQTEDEILITVTGNGFLYNMVRILAGTLLEVGRGRIDAQDVADILAAKDRSAAGPTAPACGLMLMGYEYEG